ncbi:MAG: hypothetical protein ABIN91_01505 [Mucilaginibacter sp.]|uniref:hypothetical protein n=1 Tax=Mucilaginibacter sp. TaxID=1882438 RepID=UPI00326369E8
MVGRINLSTITFAIAAFLFICSNTFAQKGKVDVDLRKKITQDNFNNRVDRAIHFLQTKQLNKISDTDHINIMMCLNTITFTHKENFDRRYNTSRYKQLERIAEKVKYAHNIIKVYTDWTANRGMGYYFPKLKMELYGTPNLYAMFEVSD